MELGASRGNGLLHEPAGGNPSETATMRIPTPAVPVTDTKAGSDDDDLSDAGTIDSSRGDLVTQSEPRGTLLDTGKDGSDSTGGADAKPRHSRRMKLAIASIAASVMVVIAIVASMMYDLSPASSNGTQSSAGTVSSPVASSQKRVADDMPRVDVDYEGLSEMFSSESEDGGDGSKVTDEWMDNLIYIQWNARQDACWPIPNGSTSPKVECGSVALIMGGIILSGDYTLTPDIVLERMEAKYGTIAPNQGFSLFMNYFEEEYGIHHKVLNHISGDQAKEILQQEGHLIIVGEGCENRYGLPFCKSEGVTPRCCHGHTILFYKYADGIFYAKDSAPGDGAAMCLYPEGPLTVTHRGAMNGTDTQNGQTVSYDHYADAFFINGWSTEIWTDNPPKRPVKVPSSVPEPGLAAATAKN